MLPGRRHHAAEGTLMDEARCPSLSLILPAYNEAAGIA
jgi:hypothetical protein